jgi:hypothetical protein
MKAIMKQNVKRLKWAHFGELDSASISGQGLKPDTANGQGLKPVAAKSVVPRGTLEHRFVFSSQGLKPGTANGQGLKPMAAKSVVPKGTLDYSPIGVVDLRTRGFSLWLSNCNRKESPIGADDINKLGFQPQRKSKDKTWKQR